MRIEALTFDVFGTVVDWRGSIVRELRQFGLMKGLSQDWPAFADAWRALYQPAMSRVRRGETGWMKLDELHRMNLESLVTDFDLEALSEVELEHLNRVWHRLDPWPDSVEGLTRMKRRYVLATLSNGNVSLIVNMAKRAALPWDVILGAEVARQYKPHPGAYLNACAMLDLKPQQCLMVAAHNNDLEAAGACGFRTAFVARPREHGPQQTTDLVPTGQYDFVARDFQDLASQLGCD